MAAGCTQTGSDISSAPPSSVGVAASAGSLDVAAADFNEDLAAVQAVFDLAPYDARTDAIKVRVQEELKRQCMAAGGFDYTPAPPVRRVGSDALAILPPLPLPTAVAERGYLAFVLDQPIDSAEADAAYDANDRRATADPGYATALFGSDDASVGGCTGEMFARIEAEVGNEAWPLYRTLVPAVEQALGQQNSQDPELLAAVAAWRACLDASGVSPPANPFAALDRYATRSGDPTSDERTVASIDLQCRLTSRVRDEYVRVYGAAARAFLEQNAAVLLELRQAEDLEAANMVRLAETIGVSADGP